MATTFYEAIKERRTIYGISKESPVSNERLQEIIEIAVKHTPTAFNSHTGRIVVLLNEQHNIFWELALKEALVNVSFDKVEKTTQRFQGFLDGYGTVLFFEDYGVIAKLQKTYTAYCHQFPIWSHNGTGMLQIIIWTSLELEGFGVSLQHYYPNLPEELLKAWHIDPRWKLIAQMPFGKPTASPGEKDISPVENRLFIIN